MLNPCKEIEVGIHTMPRCDNCLGVIPNTFRTFQNGIQISTFTSAATIPDGAAPLEIGRYAGTYYYPGYLDELRLTKGVARYTGSFVTQSAAFPETKITPRRKESALCDPAYGGPAKCKELLDTIPDFTTLYKRHTSADVQKILDGALASDESAETSSREIVKGGSKSKGAASSVDQAFEEFASK